jgi:O-acetyl-ADP-ribose deacetylase (regulator of RNase III)
MQAFDVVVGDITTKKVDVIVNAANRGMLGGGGVDGAIHRAAGPKLRQECQKLRNTAGFYAGLDVGAVAVTYGYKLPCKFVFHTVGPIYDPASKEDQHEQLKDCYRNCLEKAIKMGCASIAFPAISTGAYGFPKEQAAEAIAELLFHAGYKIAIKFVFFSEEDADTFRSFFQSRTSELCRLNAAE